MARIVDPLWRAGARIEGRDGGRLAPLAISPVPSLKAAEHLLTVASAQVTITGRQQFALPLFWQVFDPDVVPGLKDRMVTQAYQTFFDRTIANFEALVEGRDIRIGA